MCTTNISPPNNNSYKESLQLTSPTLSGPEGKSQFAQRERRNEGGGRLLEEAWNISYAQNNLIFCITMLVFACECFTNTHLTRRIVVPTARSRWINCNPPFYIVPNNVAMMTIKCSHIICRCTLLFMIMRSVRREIFTQHKLHSIPNELTVSNISIPRLMCIIACRQLTLCERKDYS